MHEGHFQTNNTCFDGPIRQVRCNQLHNCTSQTASSITVCAASTFTVCAVDSNIGKERRAQSVRLIS